MGCGCGGGSGAGDSGMSRTALTKRPGYTWNGPTEDEDEVTPEPDEPASDDDEV